MEAPTTVLALRGELFDGLGEAEVAALQGIARVSSHQAGEILFSLGDPADCLWLIDSGTVALTLPLQLHGAVQEITVDEKGPGSVIAWSAVVAPHRLAFGARAATDVGLVGFRRDELERVFQESPALHLAFSTRLTAVVSNRVFLLEALLIRNLQRWVSERMVG